MRRFHPKGTRLPALERNILRFRAFQMTLILFHIEDLKRFVVGSIRATDRNRLPADTKDLYKKAWAILVEEGVLSQQQSDDLQQIIDYRNRIAHCIQDLTFDLGRHGITDDYLRSRGPQYDYGALGRLEAYRRKIFDSMRGRFIYAVSLNPLLFDAAEKTFKQELRKLARTIRRQMRQREAEMDALNAELASIGRDLLEALRPGDPQNFSAGRLSSAGVRCCYSLFEHGLSDMAVSHLMRLSYASVRARRRRWDATRQDAIPSAAGSVSNSSSPGEAGRGSSLPSAHHP